MESNDILARLLANENINVVRGNTTTASFNIKTRLLVLPQWKNIDHITEEMLILHEVGHALFTTDEYIDAQTDKSHVFGHYLNVIEDARIERLMKSRYPGARKSFLHGYKSLIDNDFFGVQGQDLSELNLIDRINLFYKIGSSCDIKFNKKEKEFITLIDAAISIQDVIDVANKLYAYAKYESQLKSMDDIDLSGLDEEEKDPYEDDYDDELENGGFEESEEEDDYEDQKTFDKSVSSTGGEKNDKDLESMTQRNLHNMLQKSADANTVYHYFKPKFHETCETHEGFIGYKRVMKEMQTEFNDRAVRHNISIDNCLNNKKAIDFKQENNPIVNNMVKEFEMRKSASQWKRAQISKTGQIDPKKLFGYQIKDELFRQLTVVKDGKKHGMFFLLDWSGSMDYYMHDTVKQLINLVMFAKRINIPFQVCAFTSSYNHDYDYYNTRDDKLIRDAEGLGFNDNVTLLELFNHNMNERETNQMINYLLNNIWNVSRSKYSLSGTPLNDALIYLAGNLHKFIKNNSVEKMIMITLTDGESSGLRVPDGVPYSFRDQAWSCEVNKLVNHVYYVKDDITGKQYQITEYNQTNPLMSLLQDRFNMINIGFRIVNNSSGMIRSAVFNSGDENSYYNINQIRAKLRSDKYVTLAHTGYDKYYLLDYRGLNTESDMDLTSINSESTSRNAAKVLTKVLNKNRGSRVVLGKFAVEVA